jgi:hypothetical protein
MTLKINGKTVEATEFAFDGCHKIYLITNPEGRQRMVDYGYGADNDDSAILPVSELAQAWRQSCFLRFISPADLEGPDFVEQGENAKIVYEAD